MSKCVRLIGLLLFVTPSVLAQHPIPTIQKEPVAELFGGYAYTHLGLTEGTNENGVLGSIGWNAKPWLQIVADASYSRDSANGTRAVLYGNHYGPRFFYRWRNKWGTTPFAEFLVGRSRINNTITGNGELQFASSGLSLKSGIGADINLYRHFAIRLFDVDYYRTSFSNSHQNNFGLSTGIVLRFGGGRPQ